MVADKKNIVYQGAFDAPIDGVFGIASMTKAITSAAALRLADQRKITLDEPVARYLPALRTMSVLTGFSPRGVPRTRPAARAITLRHLLTHTSGLSYATWDENVKRAQARRVQNLLAFEPGARWQYGTGIDWAGRLVETLTGQTLETHFKEVFFDPLGMADTSFLIQPDKFHRLIDLHRRKPDGALAADPRKLPEGPKSFNGGGGLYSTAGDYIRFLQMILRGGDGILSPRVIRWLSDNAIGGLSAGRLQSTNPASSSDVDFHLSGSNRHTLGFLLNPRTGKLSWAGLANTFFWIDPARERCAVVLMQFLPFCDPAALSVLHNFENAVSTEV